MKTIICELITSVPVVVASILYVSVICIQPNFLFLVDFKTTCTVAALQQGKPGQMPWLKHLCPGHCPATRLPECVSCTRHKSSPALVTCMAALAMPWLKKYLVPPLHLN